MTLAAAQALAEAGRAPRWRHIALDRATQPAEQQFPERTERRSNQNFGLSDSSGGGSYSGPSGDNQAEQAHHNNRMSPEERRALRRQIDEAGHDIYRPKR